MKKATYMRSDLILFLVFFLCKVFSIGKIANWSWWIVFLPLYFIYAFSVALLLALVIFIFLAILLIAPTYIYNYIKSKI